VRNFLPLVVPLSLGTYDNRRCGIDNFLPAPIVKIKFEEWELKLHHFSSDIVDRSRLARVRHRDSVTTANFKHCRLPSSFRGHELPHRQSWRSNIIISSQTGSSVMSAYSGLPSGIRHRNPRRQSEWLRPIDQAGPISDPFPPAATSARAF
jgi:hypothetical protein